MTNLTVIENKISAVKKYLKILARYKKYSAAELTGNIDLKGAAERYLYLATQATIDLADAIIAYKKLRKPTTFSESFHILNEEKILSNDLTEKLVKMAGLRNIIAHDYEKINYEIIVDVLQNRLGDIKKFLAAVSK